MSLVFPPPNRKVVNGAPMTHALVIGIGQYLHLPGGALYATRPAKPGFGLGQLSSPPISAKEFAHWLIAYLANSRAPLGSVELVLSPEGAWTPPSAMGSIQVEPATFENIKKAFGRWYDRCSAHPENVAIFYFCGHGVERLDGHTLILAADFGADRNTPLDNAINISATCNAINLECKVRTACFFLDVCRQIPEDLRELEQDVGRRLKSGWSRGTARATDLLVLKAARFGGLAYAPVCDVSYFTKALVRCFEGLGAASPYNGKRWMVSTSSLSEAMKKYMERCILPDGKRGVCESAGASSETTVIHELCGTPPVMTTISCVPANVLPFAELSLIGAGGSPILRRGPDAAPWDTEAPAGDYEAAAHFQNAKYRDRRQRIRLAPTFLRCELE